VKEIKPVILLAITLAAVFFVAHRNYQPSVAFNVLYQNDTGVFEDRVAVELFAPSSQRFKFNDNLLLEVTYSPGLTPSLGTKLWELEGAQETLLHSSVRRMANFAEVLYSVCAGQSVEFQSPLTSRELNCSSLL